MLTDALDGTLSASDQATFDLHMVGCPACASMLADAQRGAAWMEMLKSPRPEPSSTLYDRIIAQTSGKIGTNPGANIVLGPTDRIRVHPPTTLLSRPTLVPSPAIQPAAFTSTNVLPFRNRVTNGFRSLGHTMLQPRLAMTAAMAFFSIALTMNLTGVHLSGLRASDLKPSSLKRSFYDANAKVARYYTNLRVVYELESRVNDLKRSSDSDSSTTIGTPQNQPATTTPQQKPTNDQQPDDQKAPDQKQSRPKPGPGSSRRETSNGNLLLVDATQHSGSLPVATQTLAVVSPSVLKYLQEGELV
jgi:hypothetical protein